MAMGKVAAEDTRAPSSKTSASGGTTVNRTSVTVSLATSSYNARMRGDTWPVSW